MRKYILFGFCIFIALYLLTPARKYIYILEGIPSHEIAVVRHKVHHYLASQGCVNVNNRVTNQALPFAFYHICYDPETKHGTDVKMFRRSDVEVRVTLMSPSHSSRTYMHSIRDGITLILEKNLGPECQKWRSKGSIYCIF